MVTMVILLKWWNSIGITGDFHHVRLSRSLQGGGAQELGGGRREHGERSGAGLEEDGAATDE